MEVFRNTVLRENDKPAKTKMSGVSEAEVGPPPVYGGTTTTLNPEEMFVASINSCIMLVFYHFVEKYKIDVLSYYSEANGQVEKTKNGLRFSNVYVKAEIKISDSNQAGKIEEVARLAEKYCLVSGSISCPIQYEAEVID
jgi:organic hydroperoxide reductase OsmC/OhrA